VRTERTVSLIEGPAQRLARAPRMIRALPSHATRLGLVEGRLGNASRAIDEKECRAKATFVDLALRFDELDSRILDFAGPQRHTRRCAFDLDACRRQRRDGVGAGMATRQPRLALDVCGLRGLKIRLKSRNLLHQLRSALGLGFTKALRLFDIDAELIRFGSAG